MSERHLPIFCRSSGQVGKNLAQWSIGNRFVHREPCHKKIFLCFETCRKWICTFWPLPQVGLYPLKPVTGEVVHFESSHKRIHFEPYHKRICTLWTTRWAFVHFKPCHKREVYTFNPASKVYVHLEMWQISQCAHYPEAVFTVWIYIIQCELCFTITLVLLHTVCCFKNIYTH